PGQFLLEQRTLTFGGSRRRKKLSTACHYEPSRCSIDLECCWDISIERITHARIDLPLCTGRQSGMITRGSVDSETARLHCWPLRKPSRYTLDMNQGVRVSVALAIIVMLSSPLRSVQAFPVQKRTTAARKPAPRRITREMILEAQQRLTALGYWIGDSDGKWGEASRHGLIAFQKVEGLPRTGRLTVLELAALNAANRPTPH